MQVRELELPADVEATLRQWAREAYPAEGCGLLIGPWDPRAVRTRVVRAVRTKNLVPPGVTDRYEVDPVDHLAAQREARAIGHDVVGVWHSHPDHGARPSRRDAENGLPLWSYVIVAVEGGTDGELAVYRFEDGSTVCDRVVRPTNRPSGLSGGKAEGQEAP